MNELQGFGFFCDILAIISNHSEKKARYRYAKNSGKAFNNGEKDDLVKDWTEFAYEMRKRKKEQEALLNFYYQIAPDKKFSPEDVLKKYNDDIEGQYRTKGGHGPLQSAINSVMVNQKGTRPHILFGFAMTLSLAADGYSDTNFYIGREEAKDLLFQAMDILGYHSVECLPDEYFNEKESLQKLLFAALYHAFLVVFPYKEMHRTFNLTSGKKAIQSTLDHDLDSEFYKSVKGAAEADEITRLLWSGMVHACETDMILEEINVPLENYYSAPKIEAFDPHYKILSCDHHYHIRAFVEGRSGSGKTCLAKAMVLACLKENKKEKPEFYEAIEEAVGLENRHFVPILVDCDRLNEMELRENGVLEYALDQMYCNAREFEAGNRENQERLKHYTECKPYILTYCERKAKQEELLLIIDGFSTLNKSGMNELVKQLNQLYGLFMNLHVVVFSNKIKKSEQRLFANYKFFRIKDIRNNEKWRSNILRVLQDEGICMSGRMKENRYADIFMDTPRRYIQCLGNQEESSLQSLIIECMDAELSQKCELEISEEECRMFLKRLANEALSRREQTGKPLVIPEKLINYEFFRQLEAAIEHPETIWKQIQRKSILIEGSEYINSYEFHNPMYFYSFMADSFIEVLAKSSYHMCAGTLIEGFSKLSGKEFAYIALMVLSWIFGLNEHYLVRDISEENLELFFKTMTATILSYEDKEDVEHCLWMLNEVLDHNAAMDRFLRNRVQERRMTMIRMMNRTREVLTYFCTHQEAQKQQQ